MIYAKWAKNSFSQSDKYFVIYKQDNKIDGFILFNFSNTDCIIELIAVNKEAQGKNIGNRLIIALENFLFNQKVQNIQVGSQVDNTPAVHFYTKIGFEFSSLSSTYHWWPSRHTSNDLKTERR